TMPFGKHKGSLLSDMPRDYKEWLLKQGDIDPYLRKALSV
ncbi:MAG TPA: DNA polymerase III subunit epsilon, partial [Betaproteobacteria bacterium]|nr:DNA polymerase III subunit epsilon [Betaproteobacteria bacterium]